LTTIALALEMLLLWAAPELLAACVQRIAAAR
jgi:hypothetical protein